jgi:hypothetical protein
MTADKSMESTGQDQEQGAKKTGARKSGARKSARKKQSARGATAKRSRAAAAARRSTASGSRSTGSKTRSSSRTSTSRKSAGGSSGLTSRLLSRSRRAAGNAYEWAAEGASRAIPLASRSMPDQRTVQRLVDQRPYMLGALGLGIGAMIGMMLPSPFSSTGGSSSRGRSRR